MTSRSKDKPFVCKDEKCPHHRIGEVLKEVGGLVVQLAGELEGTSSIHPDTLAELLSSGGELVWVCGATEAAHVFFECAGGEPKIEVVH